MSETVQKEQKSVNISTWKIFVGFIVGAIIGLVFYTLKETNPELEPGITNVVNNIFHPMGKAFFQGLFMIIIPLIFSSLVVGISEIGSGKMFGRLGTKLFLFYAISTFLAIGIGQLFVNTFEPGKTVTEEKAQEAAKKWENTISSLKDKSSLVGSSIWPGIVTKIIPKNIIDQFGKGNILAVIFISLIFGFALSSLSPGPARDSFIGCMSALSSMSITIIGWVMKTAPFGVAAWLAIAFSEMGWSLIPTIGWYILVLAMGMLCHLFISYGCILKFLIRIPIKEFIVRMIPVFTTSFGTSSSSATMPVTMDTLERKFGLPKSIVNFSIPVGATVNMDGTALFEVVTAVFIAQIFGAELTLINHISLIIVIFITSIGIAGVPGGSLPILIAALAMFGIPIEGIGLILGVDRVLDMGRTTVNVTGDSIAALFLGRTEGIDIGKKLKEIPR